MRTRLYTVYYIETRKQGYMIDRPNQAGWDLEWHTEKVECSCGAVAGDACRAVKVVMEKLRAEKDVSTLTGTECKVQVDATGEWVVVVIDGDNYKLKES